MIVINKRNIFNTLFAIVLIFALASSYYEDSETISVFAPGIAGKTVVIDAGHGWPDGGAVSYDGTLEKDLNLELAKRLGSFFIQSGVKVIYTREDDNAVSDIQNKKNRDIKKNDLNNRKTIAENSNGDAFISIHMNKFEDSKYYGAQVFYDGKNDESKHLATIIQNHLKKYVDNSNKRESKDSKGSIYILKNTTIPSVLIECGFLSNQNELDKLKTEKYQNELAFAIFCAVSEYILNYT